MRRLLATKSARQAEGAFVAEGANLLSSALDAKAPLEAVFCAPEADRDEATAVLVRRASDAGADVHRLRDGVIERLATTSSPQPVLSVVRPPAERRWSDGAALVLVCVDLRDPGNMGTVLRSAEAAGARGAICCEGCVDPFNPKSVRSSAGAVFHLPVSFAGSPRAALARLGEQGVRRVATVVSGGTDYALADLLGPVAIVVGNEAHGLPETLAGDVDEWLSIPMPGHSESLNVGMVAAILCFEASRQRRALGS